MSSKAEQRALEAYPMKDYNKEPNYLHTCDSKMLDEVYRDVFQLGYEQAEKDLGWHSVDKSLPPVDEEVIVLSDEMHGKKLLSACHISYGHRPNPEGWDGKSIFTGKVTHHNVVTYDGWNIPGVKYWMPMPKIKEEEV